MSDSDPVIGIDAIDMIDMEAGTQLCAEMKLIELMRHGEHRYCRITDRGRLVLSTMILMSLASADPANELKVS